MGILPEISKLFHAYFITILAALLLVYIACIILTEFRFQRLEDNYKWIRREWRLLDALIKDGEYLSKSGKEIDEKSLQLWDSQLKPGMTVRLHDAERKWLDATKTIVCEAERCVKTYEELSERRKFLSWASFWDLRKIGDLGADMDQIEKKINVRISTKKEEAKDIYGAMEKSRSNVRSLQDRPIEKQPSDVYKPSVSVASIEAKINGLLERGNPGLMLVTRGQIESIKLFVELMVAFLNDFEGLILESETEKAWVIEAEEIIGELHRDITTTTTANQMIWPLDLGSPAPIKSIDLLSDLFERKIVYGFTFIRRDRTKFLHQPPQQRTLPSQITDDFIGILSFVDKIQNFLITIEEPTMETATNNLKNLSDLFVKVYGHFRYAKAIGGMKNSRRAWTDQMKIIVRDAETSLETYRESSAPEISNSQNDTESWVTFSAEIDKLVQALSLLEMRIRVCRTELREDTNFVVGLEEDIHEVVSRLTNIEHQSSIVSIVGMKGIGKTTLAKIIYEHTAIREHFNFFLWVALTDKVAGENVLKIIGEQVPRTDNERSGKEYFIQKAREFLRRDKYLVVLDNISTNKAWDDLKEAVPGTTNGSRILLTTRYKSVAVHADQSSVPHQLRLKTKEQSWRLFTQMVRFQPELSGPELSPKVKTLANKVVGRCGGLPLSILRVGYLLSGKEATADELLRVLEHINHNQAPWSETLEIIEKDLPLHLRQCISYLSLFPRDFEIPAGRLIALWVAEGFAKKNDDEPPVEEPPESVADKYFQELISLDLVQVLARKVNRTVKTCCFPSALRELWLRLNSKITPTASLSSRLDGRLAYYFDESDGGCSQSQGRSTNSPNVKSYRNSNSILFFDTREGYKPGEDIGNFLRKGIASGHLLQLQVLDLEHVFRPQLPNIIGKLILLRYLGLRWTYLETIPSSIGKLLKLESLDMGHTYIRTLPSSIWKLQELKYLHMNETYRSKIVHHPKRNSLQNLLTLQGAFVDKDSPLKEGLYKLIKLRKLKMAIQLLLLQQEALAESLVKLTQLETLKLKSIDEMGEPQDLKLMDLSGLDNLSILYLFGKLEKRSNITTINGLPKSLTYLTLSASRLSDDPMKELEKLHNLKSLSFYSHSYIGNRMICSNGGFPKLLVLKLWKLCELEEWRVEEQAMPNLKQLEIRSCQKLEVPTGLWHLKTLHELKLKDMPENFIEKIEETKDQIWGVIAYSPAIIIDVQ